MFSGDKCLNLLKRYFSYQEMVKKGWGFNFPNFMVFCQLALFSAVITFLRYIGKITDSVVLAYTRERGSQLSVLSFLYLTNVILGIVQKI